MRKFLLRPLEDLVLGLEHVLLEERPAGAILIAVVSLLVTWFVYVPVHELLHVAGCVITGGTVSELEVAPHYGGTLLAKIFPFVVSGGEYAGRLSGFDWKGSDLIYLATDFMPYAISVLVGVPLLKMCARKRRPILFGAGIVIGFAPIYNIPGDYYEMGSIVTTRAIAAAVGGGETSAYLSLRGDDLFKISGEVLSRPEHSQVDPSLDTTSAFVVVVLSVVVGLLLALATYALGDLFARLFPRRSASPVAP